MATRSLMVLGTASHVGKSLITAAFCRIFARLGYSVAPFKAQNMSLNSAATIDGYEIGRAQALQAEAAGIFATREMNPILLKPESDVSCQIVADGRVWGHLSARDYHQHRVEELFPLVLKSYFKLAAENDLIVLEGAGSPAEINLKAHDIVNMRMAAAANAACLLVGDIDRGGVFATLLGTLELLSAGERERIRGFVINKFRGDLSLLEPGIREIEGRIHKPCVGVVPYIPDLDLDEEDSVSLESKKTNSNATGWQATTDAGRQLRIAVIDLPYLSNFTDFDALAAEPSVSLDFVSSPEQIRHADLIIIPGTKQTIQDFRWLKNSGLADALESHANHPLVVGICGGMQMMGISIADPYGMEGGGQVAGIGLLPMRTVLAREKVTAQVKAELVSKTLFGHVSQTQETSGYEIHLGESMYEAGAQPIFRIRRRHELRTRPDGVQDATGRCFGTYLHGLFDHDDFRHSFLANARSACQLQPSTEVVFRAKQKQAEINRLADVLEQSVDMDAICGWLGVSVRNIQDKVASEACL
jgi:adenosylcobyric acid synthase